MTLPLEGIRVLDLTRVWSGPIASRTLADLGAEVISISGRITIPKIQFSPEVVKILAVFPDNDPGTRPWNRQSAGNEFGRNKLGLTLELNTPEGVELFRQLAVKSDVVLENYSPRVMPNFGLDYPALKQLNPGIIMCSMPGYGANGPYRDYVSYGTNLDPASGLASLMGYPGDKAHMSGNAYPDPAAALHAASAVLTALYYRLATGKGQYIDLAQCESATCLIGEAVLGYALKKKIPEPMGNRHRDFAPQGCYPARGEDKWVVIAVSSQAEWESLKNALGNPPELESEKFSDILDRYRNHDELDRIIRDWTSRYTHVEVMHFLQKHGVPAGAVWNAAELVVDPQLNERGFFWEIDHPEVGRRKYCGLPIRLSDVPRWPTEPAPCLGQHNAYVLKNVLGFSDEKIRELEASGIVGTDPID